MFRSRSAATSTRRLAVATLVVPALVALGCSTDDAADDVADDLGDDATLTETTQLEIDDTVATTVTEPAPEEIGSIMVGEEVYAFTRIVGDTCVLDDTDAEFVVAAQTAPPLAEGAVSLTARIDRRDPERNELSVTVGEAVYEAPSARTIEIETSGSVVNGMAEVVAVDDPDASRQQVSFEVDCDG